MPLTRDFKETIRARAQADPIFRRELLTDAVQTLIDGDVETAKIVLRDYVKATIGFAELGARVDKSPKSLMQMLGPKGNPRTDNLVKILSCLQKHEGVNLEVRLG